MNHFQSVFCFVIGSLNAEYCKKTLSIINLIDALLSHVNETEEFTEFIKYLQAPISYCLQLFNRYTHIDILRLFVCNFLLLKK